MILDGKSYEYKIFDVTNNQIGFVSKYDTVTKEVTMYMPVGMGSRRTICTLENGEIVPKTVSFVLEGSYALDSKGEKVASCSECL